MKSFSLCISVCERREKARKTQGYHRPLWRKTKIWVWTWLGARIWAPSQAQIQIKRRKQIWAQVYIFAQSHSNKNVNFGSNFCALLRYSRHGEYLSNANSNPSSIFFVFFVFWGPCRTTCDAESRLVMVARTQAWAQVQKGLKPKLMFFLFFFLNSLATYFWHWK